MAEAPQWWVGTDESGGIPNPGRPDPMLAGALAAGDDRRHRATAAVRAVARRHDGGVHARPRHVRRLDRSRRRWRADRASPPVVRSPRSGRTAMRSGRPTGADLAYTQGGKVMTVAAGGGVPQEVCAGSGPVWLDEQPSDRRCRARRLHRAGRGRRVQRMATTHRGRRCRLRHRGRVARPEQRGLHALPPTRSQLHFVARRRPCFWSCVRSGRATGLPGAKPGVVTRRQSARVHERVAGMVRGVHRRRRWRGAPSPVDRRAGRLLVARVVVRRNVAAGDSQPSWCHRPGATSTHSRALSRCSPRVAPGRRLTHSPTVGWWQFTRASPCRRGCASCRPMATFGSCSRRTPAAVRVIPHVVPEHVSYESFDGMEVHGWLYSPGNDR